MDKEALLQQIRILILCHPQREVYLEVQLSTYSSEMLEVFYQQLLREVQNYMHLLEKRGIRKEQIVAQWSDLIRKEYQSSWSDEEKSEKSIEEENLTQLLLNL